MDVVGRLPQRKEGEDPKYKIGVGKVKELSSLEDFEERYLIIKKEDWKLFAGHRLTAEAVSETDKYYLLRVFSGTEVTK